MTKDEKRLIKKCLGGNQNAYKAIYDNYKAYVFTICKRYGVSAIVIKDSMQVIFMEVFKSLEKFDDSKASFKTWLTRITINQILMQKRKLRIQHISLDEFPSDVLSTKSQFDVVSKMDFEKLIVLLEEMPDQYSAVFNMYIIDGYSHKEISETLDISLSASKVILHRGRTWAKKQIAAVSGRENSLKKNKLIN